MIRPGTTALIVGASSGIGEATAAALAAEGARVVCAGRRVERLQALAARLGNNAAALHLDVTTPESVGTILDRLPPDLQALDVLVNAAGHDLGGRRRFDQGNIEDWASIVDTNVTGLMRVCHAVIPDMLKRGGGHVVNLGSVAGLRTYPGGSAYAATKFAVRAFTDCLRADYRDTALRITEILPGLTRTEFAEVRHGGDRARADAFYEAAPETLTAEDVARAVLFALGQPAHVTVAQMVLVPTREP